MKILYLGNFELPDKNAAAHRVLGIAKALREGGNEVYFTGISKVENKEKENILLSERTWQGFCYYSRPYPENNREWVKFVADITPYKEVINHIGNIDIVICYNMSAFSLAQIKRFCKLKNIFCTADITEWYSMAGRKFPSNIIKGIDEFIRMRIIHKHVNGLIVISSYLEHYYQTCKNMIRIPPLVDLNEEKWKNVYEKESKVLKLVYAGSPGRKDRIDYLIEAAGGLTRSFWLDVIGITKDEYLKLYPKHRNIVEHNDNIVFHGMIPHQEVLEYVKKANYCCFFRDRSRVSMAGFPTKFVEAISCGTPVITNDTSDLSGYFHSKNGVLLDSCNKKNIQITLENASMVQKTDTLIFDYQKHIIPINRWINSIK